jgi:hypothetical protein
MPVGIYMYRLFHANHLTSTLPLPRLYLLPRVTLCFSIFVLLFSSSPYHHDHRSEADANPVDSEDWMIAPGIEPGWERWGWNNRAKRAESRTDVCLRWSHQSVLVGDTVYIYGGQAKTSPDQTLNTWSTYELSPFLVEESDS